MNFQRILIIGNGIAGTTAAFTLRDNGFTGTITLASEEAIPAYYRTRLPEVIFGEIDPAKLLVSPPQKYQEKSIELRLETRIDKIDTDHHQAVTTRGETIEYDALVLATGSQAFFPPIPGAQDLKGIFALRNLADARAIREYAAGKKRAVCLGGGLLGLEIAFQLNRLGLQVEIVEEMNRLLPRQLDMKSGHILQSALEKQGMIFHLGIKAHSFFGSSSGTARGLEIENSGALTADLFVITAGIRPRRELIDHLGLATDRGLIVDENGETSVSGIYAAGDHIQCQDHTWGTWLAARHWGKRVGEVLAGKSEPFAFPPETFQLKVSGINLLSLGNTSPEIDRETPGIACHMLGCNPAEGKYFKVVEEMGKVTGAIILGNFAQATKIEHAVKEGYPWVNLASEFGLQQE
jgi:nitrite reductase (NADH) large subunit